jgi:hypothetical protein
MYVCMYVCIYIYIYELCMHMHTHLWMMVLSTYRYIHVCVCVLHVRMYVCMRLCARLCVCVCAFVCVCMHVFSHAPVRETMNVHVNLPMRIYICMDFSAHVFTFHENTNILTHDHIHVHAYIFMPRAHTHRHTTQGSRVGHTLRHNKTHSAAREGEKKPSHVRLVVHTGNWIARDVPSLRYKQSRHKINVRLGPTSNRRDYKLIHVMNA